MVAYTRSCAITIPSKKIKKVRFDEKKNKTRVYVIDKAERENYLIYKQIINENLKNRREIIRKLKYE
jgi:hypothetical protein